MHRHHISLVNAACSACSPLLVIERRACSSKHEPVTPRGTMRPSYRAGLLLASTTNIRRTAPAEAAQGTTMQTQSHPTPAKALPRSMPRRPEARAAAPTWKPQEVGLTRQELRDIVIDLIG
jgi:hypothetical protein